MNAVPFDTLSMARKLQASGIEAALAGGMVEALVEGINGGG
jgi:NhaP-type Na+/H+ or K+/H+ antiporter